MSNIQPTVTSDELRQRKLQAMAETVRHTKDVSGIKLLIDPNVYPPATDTHLMMNTIKVNSGAQALDIGTGTGAIAIKMALSGAISVLGVDLNPRAVTNANANKKALQLDNLTFRSGNVFEGVTGKFDIITFNPPYSDKQPANDVEICFFDENHKYLKDFFAGLRDHLKPGGIAYVAWSNFGTPGILEDLSKQHNFNIDLLAKDIGGRGYEFYVYGLRDRAQ